MIPKTSIFRQWLIVAFCMNISLGVSTRIQAQSVPVLVKKSFSKMYPKSTDVVWKQLDSLYEASFFVKEVQRQTLFSLSGEWLETRSFITLEALNEVAEKAVMKAYPGCSLEDVIWIQKKNMEYFEIMLITKLDEYTSVSVTKEGLIIEPEN